MFLTWYAGVLQTYFQGGPHFLDESGSKPIGSCSVWSSDNFRIIAASLFMNSQHLFYAIGVCICLCTLSFLRKKFLYFMSSILCCETPASKGKNQTETEICQKNSNVTSSEKASLNSRGFLKRRRLRLLRTREIVIFSNTIRSHINEIPLYQKPAWNIFQNIPYIWNHFRSENDNFLIFRYTK